MTQAEKEAVLSFGQQQYSFSAIAETIELPLGTIKSFLSRVSGKKETPDPASRITVSQTRCKQSGAPLDQTGNGKAQSFCNDRCRSLYWHEYRDLSKRASAHKQAHEVWSYVLHLSWAVLFPCLLRVGRITEGWCDP